MLADTVARHLGKFFRNVRNPAWLAAQAMETVVSQVFISPTGDKIHAYLHVHLFDGDEKIGAVYRAKDGHHYVIDSDGNRARLNESAGSWHAA